MSILNSSERPTLGRLLIFGLGAAAIGAAVGTIAGTILLRFAAPLPEDRLWFVGLCGFLTASVAAIATVVTLRARTAGSRGLSQVLAATLLGGCAGAFLAQRLFGYAPRGRQLIFFAVGAAGGGFVIAIIRRFRKDPLQQIESCSRGRWFQFTLGTLLTLTVITSAGLSLWVRGPMQRGQAMAAIEKSGGGRIRYKSRAPEWVQQLLGDAARGMFDEIDDIALYDPTDADVARLTALSNLRSLSLGGHRLTGEAMKSVAQLQPLEVLWLGETAVAPSDFVPLRRLPRLRSLQVSIGDDDSLRQIASLPTIDELRLSVGRTPRGRSGLRNRATRIPSVDAMSSLASLTHLIELSLDSMPIGDDHLTCLDHMTRLRRVCLNHTNVTDAGLCHLRSLEQLEWLELRGTNVTGSGFAELQSLTQLWRVELGGASVTDQGLQCIASLEGISTLVLHGTRITDLGLPHLTKLTRLSWLDISSTAVSDAGLPALEGLSNIAVLYHDRTNTTPAGIERLEKIWGERRKAAQATD